MAIIFQISQISSQFPALSYSQLQSGCLQLNRGAYDLCEIVENEVHRCEQSARENHLMLSFDGPEEERALIWERYQRSQHQAGRRQGTGIGLSIVKTILDAHGMTYGVDCRDGLASFWFRYPPDLS